MKSTQSKFDQLCFYVFHLNKIPEFLFQHKTNKLFALIAKKQVSYTYARIKNLFLYHVNV